MHERAQSGASPLVSEQRNILGDAQLAAVDLWKIWSLLARRWHIIAASALFFLGVACVWLLETTPLYTSTAQVLIDQRRKNPLPGESLVAELQLLDYSALETEIKLISSFAVANRAALRLKLGENPEFYGGASNSSVWSALKGAAVALFGSEEPVPKQEMHPPGQAADASSRQAAAAVQAGTTVKRVESTYFIDVSFTHSDPAVAAMVANGLAESYLLEQLEAHYQTSKRSADWLGERTASLRQQLEASERAIAEHRAKHNLVGTKTGSISDQQAAEINGQLVAARAQTVEKKVIYDQASRLIGGNAKLESVAAVMQSPIISALRQQVAEIARQEADLLTRYGPEHPNVMKIRAEGRDLKRQITTEVSRVVANLKSDYELAVSKERSLESTLKELSGTGRADEAAVIRLKELEREADANRTLYETLLARFKEAEQQQSLQSAESRIVAPASLSSSPSYPNKKRVLIVAAVLGLAFGVGLALMLEHLEQGFATVEQAEAMLQLPVLAMVPKLSTDECKIDGQQHHVPEVVLTRPLSRFGESIRSARVGTQLSDLDHAPKIVLVTSSVPSEGKTTIALSMAYSAALANQKTLLIDCDLRHPSTTKHFGLNNGPGLTDFLADQKDAANAFFRGPLQGLTILPAGGTTLHPPDVLGSEKFKQLLIAMRKAYDVVLIDAPPVTPVIDSVLLSKAVDKVVLVVSWRSTPQNVVVRTLNSLQDTRQKVAGIVLNNTEFGHMSRYSGYYNYYSKAYDKYYS